MDSVISKPQNDWGSSEEDFLDYVLQKLMEQPNNSFNHLRNFVPATEASMWSSAVLSMDEFAIASSSKPTLC